MAIKIGVIEHGATRVTRHLKRSIATGLVHRRLIAVWEDEGRVIRMLSPDVRPASAGAAPVILDAPRYVPERMPSPEVPGVKFRRPRTYVPNPDICRLVYLPRA